MSREQQIILMLMPSLTFSSWTLKLHFVIRWSKCNEPTYQPTARQTNRPFINCVISFAAISSAGLVLNTFEKRDSLNSGLEAAWAMIDRSIDDVNSNSEIFFVKVDVHAPRYPTQLCRARSKTSFSACFTCILVSLTSSLSFKQCKIYRTVNIVTNIAGKQSAYITCVFGSKLSYTPSLLLLTLSIATWIADIERTPPWSIT